MPIDDWQFWIVTIIMIGALWMLKSMLLPKKKGTKTTLTVGGKPVDKRASKTTKHQSTDCGWS